MAIAYYMAALLYETGMENCASKRKGLVCRRQASGCLDRGPSPERARIPLGWAKVLVLGNQYK